MLDPHKRRKVSVHLEGTKPDHAADGIADGPDAAADRPAENQNGAEAGMTPATVGPLNGATKHSSLANERAEGSESLANGDGDTKAARGKTEMDDSLANGKRDAEPVVELLSVEDIWSFKRGLEVFSSPK